ELAEFSGGARFELKWQFCGGVCTVLFWWLHSIRGCRERDQRGQQDHSCSSANIEWVAVHREIQRG
ncbi:MAG: hypothetical protein ACKPJJ_36920, partial [Planctomycetaceae bacterium]